ncbi:MAG: glycoside hydrolase family 65 protein [Spirochaetota bacterium]
MEIRENLSSPSGWEIREERFDAEQIVTNGSNFMTGNGYLGYRGTFPEWTREHYVGCTVTDTWDNADGKWTELCTVPNALFLRLSLGSDEEGEEVALGLPGEYTSYLRELDVRYGIHRRSFSVRTGSTTVRIEDERFASYETIHLIPARMKVVADHPVTLSIIRGIDSEVWSLNGDHFASHEPAAHDRYLEVVSTTGERATRIAVSHGASVEGGRILTSEAERSGPSVFVNESVRLDAGEELVITSAMSVYTSNDLTDPAAQSAATLERFLETGYESALDAHKKAWDRIWAMSEIEIDGDERAIVLLRYNMYQNFIATPAHTDHLPIGARGLSCQAYQGAAFWDQEIFNLPVYLYSRPEVARNILTYRHKTIDGARKKARDLGYRGAFYAWISADTGEEICPSFFFEDVLSGRPIHNHFNDWQIHVSPDIAYTVWKYFQATGDFEFMRDHGAEIVFDVMRFLASRVFYHPTRDRYEIIRLLGPDEYHENVDNNFFTAYQTRYVAELSLELLDFMQQEAPGTLRDLRAELEIDDEEVELWRDIAAKLSVKEPDAETGVIEQFDGFFELEDITPEELAKRLKDPGEYWGWPNGIAVETQVSKQADVTQLFALHPHAYDRETMRANYDYYEPRTQHGSSLSFSVYSIVAAWTGDLEEAHRYFIRSCSVDLMNTGKAISGGTFIGGIHTAACGVAWQIVVSGFGGVTVNREGLSINPVLPTEWERLTFPFVYRGNRISVTVRGQEVEVQADASNAGPVPLTVRGREHSIAPGERALC